MNPVHIIGVPLDLGAGRLAALLGGEPEELAAIGGRPNDGIASVAERAIALASRVL